MKKGKIISKLALCLAVVTSASALLCACGKNTAPIDFLMNENLSDYISIDYGGAKTPSFDYSTIRADLISGYEAFRRSLTNTYFGSNAFVEEGCTLSFVLTAELKDGETAKEYKLNGESALQVNDYRPFSDPEYAFFDKALAEAGDENNGTKYLTINKGTSSEIKSYDFEAVFPEDYKNSELAGKTMKFSIVVSDYISRYALLYSGREYTENVLSGYYSAIIPAIVKPAENAEMEIGDLVKLDVTDVTKTDGEEDKTDVYDDRYFYITEDYLETFGTGRKSGETFTKTYEEENDGKKTVIEESIHIKEIFKKSDIASAVKEKYDFESMFDFREELYMWSYAENNDGILNYLYNSPAVTFKKDAKALRNAYMKIEDKYWENDDIDESGNGGWRKYVMDAATRFGDETALAIYNKTGNTYGSVNEFLKASLSEHVDTMTKQLIFAYKLSEDFDILDGLYEKYEKDIAEIINEHNADREKILFSVVYNGDDAYEFYTGYLASSLGDKLSRSVSGAEYIDLINAAKN